MLVEGHDHPPMVMMGHNKAGYQAWIEGSGYAKTGAILGVAGTDLPDFTPLALGLSLCSDATVGDDGTVIGDPTEAALVVLAAKMGVDAEATRRAIPRLAEVPFDSDYKFMATFHDRPSAVHGPVVSLPHLVAVKGGPDVVLDRLAESHDIVEQVVYLVVATARPVLTVRDHFVDVFVVAVHDVHLLGVVGVGCVVF